MIEVPQYKQQDQITAIPSPNPANVSPAAFGTDVAQQNQQVGNAASGLGKILSDHMINMQVQKDQASVLENINNFQQQAQQILSGDGSKENPGIMNKQGYNAEGITKNFNQQMKQLSQQYGANMVTPMMQNEFQRNVNDFSSRIGRYVADHEAQQVQSAQKQSLNTYLDNTNQGYMAGQYSLTDAYKTSSKKIPYMQSLLGIDADTATQMIQNKLSAAAIATAKGYVGQGDVNSLTNLINEANGKINGEALDSIKDMVQPLKQRNETYQFKSQLANDPSMHLEGDLNKPLDQVKISAYIDKLYGSGATKTVTVPGQFTNSVDAGLSAGWNSWGDKQMDNGRVGCAEAVGKIGGFYNPFLAQEAKNNVVYVPTMVNDAKEAGVNVVPYAANQVEKGDCIVYGDQDHIVIADGKGGFYGNSSNANNGQGATVHGSDYTAMGDLVPTQIIKTSQNVPEGISGSTTQTVSAGNPVKYEAYKQAANEAVQESKIAYSNNLQQTVNSLSDWAKANPSASAADIEQQVSNAGLTGQDYWNLVSKIKQDFGIMKSFNTQAAQQAYQNAQEDIMGGNIRTAAELDAKYGGSIPLNRLNILKNSFKTMIDSSLQEPPELQAKLGEEAMKAGIADAGYTKASVSGDDDSYQGGLDSIRQKVTAMIIAERQSGNKVTANDIRNWSKSQASRTQIDAAGNQDYLYKVPSGSIYVPGMGYGKPVQ